MVERIIKFGRDSSLVGILTEADRQLEKGLCVIISNSGLIHKPGPNRLSVKIARSLAMAGIHSFRFDFSGTGDSLLSTAIKDTLSTNILEIKAAMDKITQLTGIGQFALYGLCSAADVSFRASLEDHRVSCLILVDGFYHSREVMDAIYPEAARRCSIRYYKKNLFSARRWVKLLSGKSKALNRVRVGNALRSVNLRTLKRIGRAVFAMREQKTADTPAPLIHPEAGKWKSLVDRKVAINLIYSEGSPYIDLYNLKLAPVLKDYRRSNRLDFHYIRNADHTFTPVWSQSLLTDLICNWVAKRHHSLK